VRAKILAVGIALVAMCSTLVGTATAAPNTLYCLNGLTTTLPAGVGFVGGSATLGEGAATFIIANRGGVFYAGSIEGQAFIFITDFPGQTPELDPGFSTNFIALGACSGTFVPAVTHVNVCKYLKRSDGQIGRFQQITVPAWNDSKGQYFDAPAANWVEGLGLTCDDPVALGYKATNTFVSWGGKAAPDHDPKGVRGSGFNNIYPYFTK
jgi:hypothetical protein